MMGMDAVTAIAVVAWIISVLVVMLIYSVKRKKLMDGLVLGLLLGIIAIPIALFVKSNPVE